MPPPKFSKASEPVPERQMTTLDLMDATGMQEVDTLEEVEIIFNSFTELGGLEDCGQLQSLTLINGGLLRLSNLHPVSMTLERLCLCDQKLTRISDLHLPCLRELLLQQNAITAIEGLDGCPRLQRLWLWSNKITRLEGLTNCGELREIWLQDNRISRVSGLSGMVHLESLAMAGNRVGDYRELHRLASLPGLKEVSFRDAHFGNCPVCGLEGYRNAALLSLRQLKVLDGLEVSTSDRTVARDAYLDRVFQFNAKVEELARVHAREVVAIEQRRKRVDAHSAVLTQEVVASLGGLEKLVSSGRDTIAAEQRRQVAVRNLNAVALESGLAVLAKRHALEVARRIAQEEACGREEQRLLRCLEARYEAEREQAVVLVHLAKANHSSSCRGGDKGGSAGGKDEDEGVSSGGDGGGDSGGGSYACALLSEHAPPFQVLARHARASQAFARHTDSSALLHLVRCFQLFAKPLASAFAQFDGVDSTSSDSGGGGVGGGGIGGPGGGGVQRLYWCGSPEEQAAVVVKGFAGLASASASSGFVHLHSDPALALQHQQQRQQQRANGDAGGEEEEGGGGGDGEEIGNHSLGLIGAVVSVSSALDAKAAVTVQPPLRTRPTSASCVVEHAAEHAGKAAAGAESTCLVVRYAAVTTNRAGSGSDDTGGEGDEELGSGSGGGGQEVGFVVLVPVALLLQKQQQQRQKSKGSFLQTSSATAAAAAPSSGMSERLLPEAHCLVASGALIADRRRIEARLEELAGNSLSSSSSPGETYYSPRPTTGGSGGSGRGGGSGGGLGLGPGPGSSSNAPSLLEELEALVDDEVARYEERVWEEVDPETADKLREQDAEVARKEEASAAVRGRIEGEREGQDALLRDFRGRQQQGGNQPTAYQQQQQQQPGMIPYVGSNQRGAAYGGGGGGGRGREGNTAARTSTQNHRPSSAAMLYASDPRGGR